jgi:hypothetical protein
VNLDELIAQLEQIRANMGGNIRVYVRTSYHDDEDVWDDVDELVRKVAVDNRRNTCSIDGESYKIYL